ncbi:NAD-dependent epimerase/dehydratase family protein [Corynebacterium guangdongense]|uniref:Nucleoside-diphosphate-sugar epimerase n=1 Tax=Corynebacterium guangdongense TaxID=1783348 RepID=A0ABU2A0P0_9CORY|nr:NAD-dependent epimerase/dehydratase family protein [Corynebacterium guangdongense]MDR7330655.1 nucleoside-diphosphate-sugar epimerase [Corynebacterium guangdongense]WJZ16671.1 hypothetical protein CGUA_00310 [Corynebacterium guangdongense]
MRIAVVGATGNAGTAVLRAAHRHPEITEVVGIARRLPDQSIEPYDQAEWRSIDIAAGTGEDEAVAALTEAFQGVDAVIHLAWLVQPNNRRELLRRVNVEGTRRVAEAAAAAGVGQLVVASSVGAYSPDEARKQLLDDGSEPPRRDESFPTEGIDTSHYSVDKASQEDVLDAFEDAHPEVTVTRLRPALLFQSDAASEIQRYFLGSSVPPQMLAPKSLPTLPLPAGLRLQALHTQDVGEAYVAAVVAKRPGAFNVCADDVLGPKELAGILTSSGRYFELPPGIVRAALVAGHASGVVPADAGWLDMGMQVPLMDNARAKSELGWAPTHTAAEALTELLEGLAEGRGHASPPLIPRNKVDKNLRGTDQGAGEGAGDDRVTLPEHIDRELFELYLSDHLTGATGGLNRSQRMANDYVDTPVYAQLGEFAEQLAGERDFLEQLIHDFGLSRKPYRQAVAWTGERIGRLKGNGHAVTRSPMTLLLETDLMRGAINGKVGLWETLRDLAPSLGLEEKVFTDLIDAVAHQRDLLDQVHAYARPRAFTDTERN